MRGRKAKQANRTKPSMSADITAVRGLTGSQTTMTTEHSAAGEASPVVFPGR